MKNVILILVNYVQKYFFQNNLFTKMNKYPTTYNNLSIMKEVKSEVSPQELQRISVGPSQLD